MASLKMSTKTGQVYIDNKCLHSDERGHYTIGTTKFMGKKIQIRQDIKDPQTVQEIEKFCNS